MNNFEEFQKVLNAPKPKYMVFETTDMRSGKKTYKIFLRGTAGGHHPPIEKDIPTRAEAERRAKQLEECES